MTHTVITSGAASGSGGAEARKDPVTGPLWRNPVLTVREPDQNGQQRQVTILFHGGGGFGAAEKPHLIVNPWRLDHETPTVRIEGEDLFALRELLAEFPEEAFKRPKDPVKVPDSRWTDGDVVLFFGGGKPDDVWTRDRSRWHRPGMSIAIADRDVDAVVDRKRPLLPGDVGRRAKILRQQRS